MSQSTDSLDSFRRYDHQMVIDSDNHKLYVFGGKLEAERESEVGLESRYSGLYEYDLTLHTWRLLLCVAFSLSAFSCLTNSSPPSLKVATRILQPLPPLPPDLPNKSSPVSVTQ